jgi:micrococcal nuclease
VLYPAELRGQPQRRHDSALACKSEEDGAFAIAGAARNLLLTLVLPAMLFGAAPSVAVAADCPLTDTESATIADVADDGTLRLDDGATLRLAGIDLPRRPLALTAAQPWPPADAARDGLRRLTTGAPIRIAPTNESPDRYGRRHVFAFLADGRSVQGEMVAAGLARARFLPGESECFQSLLAGEKPARDGRLGLWGGQQTAIAETDDPSLLQRTGLYAVVEGRLVSVGHGAPMTFLDFGRDYRRDFTVMLSPQVAKGLAAAGVAVDELTGKRVRVRGVIEDSTARQSG